MSKTGTEILWGSIGYILGASSGRWYLFPCLTVGLLLANRLIKGIWWEL